MSERRPYSPGLTKGRPSRQRGDLAQVLQISEAGVGQLVEAKLIATERIHPNPGQPRRSFDEETLAELAESIRARGMLQPIRVRRHDDGFQIIAGERRFRAAQLAGLQELPAVVVEQDDDQTYLDSLIENIQREDLNPLDRAEALKQLRVNLGLQSWEAVGQAIGLTRQSIYNLLNLTTLPPSIQEDVRSGDLTEKHGRALHQLNRRPELQATAYETIVTEQLSGDEALTYVRTLRDEARQTAPPSPLRRGAADLERRVHALEGRVGGEIDERDRREVHATLMRTSQRLMAMISRLAD